MISVNSCDGCVMFTPPDDGTVIEKLSVFSCILNYISEIPKRFLINATHETKFHIEY